MEFRTKLGAGRQLLLVPSVYFYCSASEYGRSMLVCMPRPVLFYASRWRERIYIKRAVSAPPLVTPPRRKSYLNGNALSTLPDGIFQDLTALNFL